MLTVGVVICLWLCVEVNASQPWPVFHMRGTRLSEQLRASPRERSEAADPRRDASVRIALQLRFVPLEEEKFHRWMKVVQHPAFISVSLIGWISGRVSQRARERGRVVSNLVILCGFLGVDGSARHCPGRCVAKTGPSLRHRSSLKCCSCGFGRTQ